jgi:TolB-like protein/DNA-binding winged helix-turn-helix (wHTH) protein/Flp pilus assembly protein TadD
MAVELHKKYLLGDLVLEPKTRRLSKAGVPVHLTRKPFQVLLYLVEHHDRLVTRRELLEQFWEGHDVYDETLTKCVGAIRKALDDQTERPRFIETHWSEGYRFICQVEEQLVPPETTVIAETQDVKIVDEEESNHKALPADREDLPLPSLAQAAPPLSAGSTSEQSRLSPGQKRFSRRVPFAMICLFVALIAGAFYLYRHRAGSSVNSSPPIRSIAVLPLKNLSDDPANEYFSDGLTESLITALSRINGLSVISRSSVFRFKGQEVDPREVGKQLSVAAVLEGSVRKDGESVRVAVRLVSADDGRVLWTGDTRDRALGDLFALQDEIARSLVTGMRVQLSSEGERALAHHYTDDVEAYQLYLKGRFFWNKRTEEGLRKSIELFEQARARDSGYALAYAGLADAYALLNLYSAEQQRDAFPRAKEAAERALKIDDTLAEPHTTLGYVKEQYDWDWVGAEIEYKRSIELNPNYATAHQYYSEYLALLGRTEESVAQIERAHQLDPFSLIINTELSYPYICARNWDEALKYLGKAIEMDPSFHLAVYYSGRCRLQKGEFDEAISEGRRAVALSGGSSVTLGALGYAYAVAGRKAQAREVLQGLTKKSERSYVSPYLIATIHAGLGEKGPALAWLEKAYNERDYLLVMLRIDPRLDNLRAEPAFASLLRRVGLST